jgi:hypothetical protein
MKSYKKIHILISTLLALASLSFHQAPGWAATPEQSEGAPSSPVVLCLPGVYSSAPGDCAPLGPSGYLSEMAALGITLPLTPLPAASTDPALSQVDVSYGEVRNPNAPIFGSMEAAIGYKKKDAVQKLNGDFVFISYTQLVETGGKKLYQVGPDQWMTANDVSRIGVLPPSQGLVFSRTPGNDFGWVLTYWASEPPQTKRTPGYHASDYSGRTLNLYDVVQIYAETEVDGQLWYLIGPDEWAPGEYIARVDVNTTPLAGVDGDRWIEVNLHEQTLMVYDRRELVFATIIASGFDPFWTRPGLFQVYEKHDSTPMRGAFEADLSDAYYLEDVPWTMYFDDARALHGAYWRAKMGFEQSHGCVNLTVGDAHWIYDWAQVGDWVYVWDPSGQTPTDPSLYSSGGY